MIEETDACAGNLFNLPSTDTGRDRYMRHHTLVVIVTFDIVRYPDTFLIITCNAKWK